MSASSHEMALIISAHNRTAKGLAGAAAGLSTLHKKSGILATGFKTLGKIGAAAVVGLAVAIGVGIGKSISAYAKFEDKLNQSFAIMGDLTEETKKKMSDAAREVAKTTTFSAESAAEAYFFLASAGLDAEASIAAMPQVAAFAQAGMFDLATATDLATDAQSALGLTVRDDAVKNLENMTRVTDVLVKANTLANASVQQFSESLTNKAGGSLKVVNKDIEEGVAVLAAFADQGVKGAQGGTALSIVFRDLQTQALKNKGAFKDFGVEVFDSNGKMNNMADIVEDLEGAMAGLSDAEKKATLAKMGFNDRSIQFMQLLLGTSDTIRGYEKELRSAGGMTQEVANKQLQSINAQWQIFKNRITDVFIGLGEKLAPVLKKVLDWLNKWAKDSLPKVIDKLSEWGSKAVEIGKIITTWVIDKIKQVINWYKNLSPEVKDAIKWGGLFVVGLTAIAVAIGLVTAALGLLMSPVVLVAGAIFAVGFAFKRAYDECETFRNIVDTIVQWFQNEAIPILKIAWEKLVEIVTVAIEAIRAIVDKVLTVIKHIWRTSGDQIKNIVKAMWGHVRNVFENAAKIIQGIFEFIKAIMTGKWKEAWQAILKIVKSIWSMIKGYIVMVFNVFKEFWIGFWNAIKGKLSDIWNSFKGVVSGAWNSVRGWIGGAISSFTGWWGDKWTSAKNKFLEIWNALKGIAHTAWMTFRGWLTGAWDSLSSWWSDKWQTLSDAVGKIMGGIAGVVKGAFNGIIGVVESALNVFIDGVNLAISAMNVLPFVSISKVSKVSFPRLAEGGTIQREGLAIVGERGKEVVNLPHGAQVTPLRRFEKEHPSEVRLSNEDIDKLVAAILAILSDNNPLIGQITLQGTNESLIEQLMARISLEKKFA